MWRELKSILRAVVRQPLVATVVVGTVALGIGGSVAVFSVVNAVLIRDLPYRDAGRLYVMRAVAPDGRLGNITHREFTPIYQNDTHAIVEKAAIVWSQDSQIVGSDQRPHLTVRYGVTDRFFDVFGTRMAIGSGFRPGDLPGRIVISYPIWRDAFGSDPNIIGQRVMAEGMSLEVVGVTPADFEFPENPGFWYLMRLGSGFDKVRGYRGFMRLREGSTPEQIDAEMKRVAATLGQDPVTKQTPILVAQPLLEHVVGDDLTSTVMIVFGATGILFLIACINVTNLLLSRATVRSREVALREALGAGRWRILYPFLIESLVLATIGGALGLAAAAGGVRLFLAVAPTGLPRLDTVPIDRTVLLFAAGATLLTGVLVGLAPAIRLARNQLRSLINEGGRGASGGPAQNRVFSVLVVTETALAVVLVVGAGLLVRSYYNLTTTDPGFNPHRVLTVSMNVPGRITASVRQNAQGKPEFQASYAPMASFFRELEERLSGITGVSGVATTTLLPLDPDSAGVSIDFTLPERTGAAPDAAAWTSPLHSVSPEFFDTMDMKMLTGRNIGRSDQQGSPGAAVVNETFVRRFLSGGNPLGQRIRWRLNRYVPTDTGFQFGHLTVEEVEVVGVVTDAKYTSLAKSAEPAIYVSSEQFIFRRRTVAVRSAGDNPESLVSSVRRELAAMDPLIGARFAVYDSIVHDSIARQRVGMSLLVAFGLAALLLAAVGVYGLLSYSVAQRTGEIAVRSAMGSSAAQLMRLVMGKGLRLAVAGIVIGALGAVALRQVLAGQLYGVSPLDLSVFLLVIIVLFGVSVLACVIPARRATRIDPVTLLKAE
jgi:putative ABC transport system permease protein